MAYEPGIPDDHPLLQAALVYLAAGRSVAPIAPKQKYPQGNAWKVFQTRLATPEEIKSWFRGSPLLGLCIICGKVSGSLENIDFDDFQTYGAYVALVAELGYKDLLQRLVIEQTPRPGIHLGYRCEVISGNTTLARQKIGVRPDGKDEVKTLIETRGEGGLIVCYPTPPGIHPENPEHGYELIQGNWTRPPLITPEEREILWNCARALNRYTPEDHPHSYRAPSGAEDRVGNDYNAKVSVDELLELLESEHWQKTYSQGNGHYLRRPGKTRGSWSATLNICGPKRFYVFTTNGDPFDNDRSYDPFGVYMRLKHGGDAKAAAKALAALGYGHNGQPGATHDRPQSSGHQALQRLDEKIHLTDIGNGLRLVQQFGNDIRFVAKWRKWLLWHEGRWVIDEGNLIEWHAKQVIAGLYRDAAAKLATVADDIGEPSTSHDQEVTQAKAIAKWAHTAESGSHIETISGSLACRLPPRSASKSSCSFMAKDKTGNRRS